MSNSNNSYLNVTISKGLNEQLKVLQVLMKVSRSSLVSILLAKQIQCYNTDKKEFKYQIQSRRPKLISYDSDCRVRFSIRIPKNTLNKLQDMAQEFYQDSLSKMVMTLLRKGLKEKRDSADKKKICDPLSWKDAKVNKKMVFNTSCLLYDEIRKRAESMNIPVNNMISLIIWEYLIES